MKKVYAERVKNKIRPQTVRVKYTKALPVRAASVARSLGIMDRVFKKLYLDEHFVTLLRAESMTGIPEFFRSLVEEGRYGYESEK